jgi:hypothetical protein
MALPQLRSATMPPRERRQPGFRCIFPDKNHPQVNQPPIITKERS